MNGSATVPQKILKSLDFLSLPGVTRCFREYRKTKGWTLEHLIASHWGSLHHGVFCQASAVDKDG